MTPYRQVKALEADYKDHADICDALCIIVPHLESSLRGEWQLNNVFAYCKFATRVCVSVPKLSDLSPGRLLCRSERQLAYYAHLSRSCAMTMCNELRAYLRVYVCMLTLKPWDGCSRAVTVRT